MSRRTVIARKLILIAGRILVSSIDSDFENALRKSRRIGSGDLSDIQIECLIERMKKTSQPKMKGFLKWLFEKGIVELPKDRSGFMEFGKDFEAACDALGKEQSFDYQTMKKESDFLKLVHPEDYPEDPRCLGILRKRYLKEVKRRGFRPEASFGNGKRVSDDTVFYDLKDTNETMREVRQALDFAYGLDRDPWCLITRHYKEPDFSEGSRNNEKAWGYWNRYSKCPKRIAFENGSPVAFYADWEWWDLENENCGSYPYGEKNMDEDYFDEHVSDMDKEAKFGIASESKDGHILRVLSEDDDFHIRMAVFKNENADDGIRERIVDNETDPDNVLEILSHVDEKGKDDGYGCVDDGLIRKMTGKIRAEDRKRLADEARFEGILSALSEDDDFLIRKCVLENENTDDSTVIGMIERETNSDCVSEFLEYVDDRLKDERMLFLRDGGLIDLMVGRLSDFKRRFIAGSARSEDVMESLMGTGDREVMEALAGNRHAKDGLLERLLVNDDADVRIAAVRNKNVQGYCLDGMIEGERDRRVLAELAKKEGLSDEAFQNLLDRGIDEVNRNIARNRDVPRDVLMEFLNDGRYMDEICGNESLPEDEALALIERGDDALKARIARNNGSSKVLHELVHESGKDIIHALSMNSHISRSDLDYLYDRYGRDDVELCLNIIRFHDIEHYLDLFSEHPNKIVRDEVRRKFIHYALFF